jgi:hypothetical protein
MTEPASKTRESTAKSTSATSRAEASFAKDVAIAAAPSEDAAQDPGPNPAGLYGFNRAEELDLNFSKAFSQQFVMRRDPDFRRILKTLACMLPFWARV